MISQYLYTNNLWKKKKHFGIWQKFLHCQTESYFYLTIKTVAKMLSQIYFHPHNYSVI